MVCLLLVGSVVGDLLVWLSGAVLTTGFCKLIFLLTETFAPCVSWMVLDDKRV